MRRRGGTVTPEDGAFEPWDEQPGARVADGWDGDELDDDWEDDGAAYEYEYIRRRGSRAGVAVAVIFSVLVILLAAGGGIAVWVLRQIHPSGPPGETVTFIVDEGDSLAEIADRLQRQDIITNASVFRWYAQWKDAGPFQAGYYELTKRADMGDIIAALEKAPPVAFTNVTFPEGFTLGRVARQIEDRVEGMTRQGFIDALLSGQFRSKLAPDEPNLEGLLFPDTYQVASNETEGDLLARMLRQMERVADELGYADAPARVGLSPYQTLIVASMIEKEAKVAEDRPKIARVIYNRLAQGMPLQIDATVIYALGGDVPRLTFAMIDSTDSPYNTYKHPGLPPTPIAMPGRAAMEAAINPADGPWLYYVVIDADGRHAFGTTLEEHNQNIARAEAAGVR